MSKFIVLPQFWLCWFTGLGGLSVYFLAHEDPITSSVIGLVGIAGLAGYGMGAEVGVAFLTATAACTLFPTSLADFFGPPVAHYFGASGVPNRILAVVVGCVTSGLAAMLIVEVVWNRILGNRELIGRYNRFVGLSLGAIQGAILSMLILGGILVLKPYARFAVTVNVRTVGDSITRSAADSVIKIARSSDDSSIGPIVSDCNPFERVPQLQQLCHDSKKKKKRILIVLPDTPNWN